MVRKKNGHVSCSFFGLLGFCKQPSARSVSFQLNRDLGLSGLALLSFGLACGSDATPEPGELSPPPMGCTAETRGEAFSAGMAKMGSSGLTVTLAQATPAPPARNDNHWMLKVVGSNGQPLAGLTVTIDPQMPDHGHGSPREAAVVDMGNGMYHAEPVALIMPGFWEVGVKLQAEGLSDSVKFGFCIP